MSVALIAEDPSLGVNEDARWDRRTCVVHLAFVPRAEYAPVVTRQEHVFHGHVSCQVGDNVIVAPSNSRLILRDKVTPLQPFCHIASRNYRLSYIATDSAECLVFREYPASLRTISFICKKSWNFGQDLIFLLSQCARCSVLFVTLTTAITSTCVWEFHSEPTSTKLRLK